MAGEAALHSVGGYQLERHRHSSVRAGRRADYFTILGLPLLPLLGYLRQHQYVDG
ncbi:MAG: hypothetical protein WDN48_08465 [Pseudolabrys sp.]